LRLDDYYVFDEFSKTGFSLGCQYFSREQMF